MFLVGPASVPAKLAELVRAHTFPELFEATASRVYLTRRWQGRNSPGGDFCRGLGR